MFNNYGSIVNRHCQCQPRMDTEAQMEGRTVVNNYGTVISRKCTGSPNRKIFRLGTLNNYGTFVFHKCSCDAMLLSIENFNNYGTIVICRMASCPLVMPLQLGHHYENVSMLATLGMPPGNAVTSSGQSSRIALNPFASHHLTKAQKVSQGNPSHPSGSSSSDYLKHFSPSATSTPIKPLRKMTTTFSAQANSLKPPTMVKPTINEAMIEPPKRVVKQTSIDVKPSDGQLSIKPSAPKINPYANPPKSQVNPTRNSSIAFAGLPQMLPRKLEELGSAGRVYKLPQKRKIDCYAKPWITDSSKQHNQELISFYGPLFKYFKIPLFQGYKKLKFNSQNH